MGRNVPKHRDGFWRTPKTPRRRMLYAAMLEAGFSRVEARPFVEEFMRSIGTDHEPLLIRQYRAMAIAGQRAFNAENAASRYHEARHPRKA